MYEIKMTKANRFRLGKYTTVRRFILLTFLTTALAGIYGEKSIAAETLNYRHSHLEYFEQKTGLGAIGYNLGLSPRSLVNFDRNPQFQLKGITNDNLTPALYDYRPHRVFPALIGVEVDHPWEPTSVRLTLRPARNWMMQFSHGWLVEPKGLYQGISIEQTTFSTRHRVRTKATEWSSIFKWERNNSNPGKIFDTILIQSQLTLGKVHTLFGGIKHAPLNQSFLGTNRTSDPTFTGHQIKLGYHYVFPKTGGTRYRVGTAVTLNGAPQEYKSLYSRGHYSVFTFLNIQFN